jgi:hypothetical protein
MKTLLPWSRPGRLWRAACHVSLGLVMGILTFSVTITLLALSVGLLITFFLACPQSGCCSRCRAASAGWNGGVSALMDVEIADRSPAPRPGWLRRLAGGPLRARWRESATSLLPVGGLRYAPARSRGQDRWRRSGCRSSTICGSSAKFCFFELTGGGAVAAAVVSVAGLVFVAPWITLARQRQA